MSKYDLDNKEYFINTMVMPLRFKLYKDDLTRWYKNVWFWVPVIISIITILVGSGFDMLFLASIGGILFVICILGMSYYASYWENTNANKIFFKYFDFKPEYRIMIRKRRFDIK